MFNRIWLYFAGGLVAWAIISPAKAQAKGFVVVTWGDTIVEVGDVPSSSQYTVGAKKVGYKYHYCGLFWVDFWTSDGEYCVYTGDRYRPIQPAEAARLLGKAESDMSSPFLYRWPLGWFIVVPLWVIGLIASAIEEHVKATAKRRAAEALAETYFAQAVNVYRASLPAGTVGQREVALAMEAAILYLVGKGIARNDAAQKLPVVLLSAGQTRTG